MLLYTCIAFFSENSPDASHCGRRHIYLEMQFNTANEWAAAASLSPDRQIIKCTNMQLYILHQKMWNKYGLTTK